MPMNNVIAAKRAKNLKESIYDALVNLNISLMGFNWVKDAKDAKPKTVEEQEKLLAKEHTKDLNHAIACTIIRDTDVFEQATDPTNPLSNAEFQIIQLSENGLLDISAMKFPYLIILAGMNKTKISDLIEDVLGQSIKGSEVGKIRFVYGDNTFDLIGVVKHYVKAILKRNDTVNKGKVDDFGNELLKSKVTKKQYNNSTEIETDIKALKSDINKLRVKANAGNDDQKKKATKEIEDKTNQLEKLTSLKDSIEEIETEIESKTETVNIYEEKIQNQEKQLAKEKNLEKRSKMKKVIEENKRRFSIYNSELKNLKNKLNSKLHGEFFSMKSLIARVARVNNFACTGKWYCPDCGAKMTGNKCEECGCTC